MYIYVYISLVSISLYSDFYKTGELYFPELLMFSNTENSVILPGNISFER